MDEIEIFSDREIDASQVIWQALAAVIDGKDDGEAEVRLEALNPEDLRVFHFQLDRIRTLTRNVRFRKMKKADDEAKQQHDAEVKRTEES